MASGNYPVSIHSPEGRALREAIEAVRKARDEMLPPHDDSQFDNAASDGAHIAYVDLAIELLERCVG